MDRIEPEAIENILSSPDAVDEPDTSTTTEDTVEQVSELVSTEFTDTDNAVVENELANTFDIPDVTTRMSADALVASLAPFDATEIKVINREIKLNPYAIEEQLASILALEPFKLDLNESQRIAWQAENVKFSNSLDRLNDVLQNESQTKHTGSASASEAIVGATISVTAGVLVWTLRGGALLASLFSVSPMWKLLDPLPIVNANQVDSFGSDDDKKDRDVEELFDNKGRRK